MSLTSPDPERASRVSLPHAITVREVGPRDGLQAERSVSPVARAELALALVHAGLRRIEAASFVSEKAVPAMAGAAEVIAAIRAGLSELVAAPDPAFGAVVVVALVPNLRGAEAALAAGVDELTVTVAASPEYNERNVRRTIDESVVEIDRICEAATGSATPVDVVVSCAFGSPYEGDLPASAVAALASRLAEAGAVDLTLADTTGMATPRVVEEVLAALAGELPGCEPGLHLHETRGTALLNAYAAMELGVTRFDTSIGGLGGSPFASGAGGNLATEDLVALCDDLGVETGVDLGELLAVAPRVAELVGHDLPGRIQRAGPRLPLERPGP